MEKDWAKSASKDFVSVEMRKKETHFENTLQTCNATCNNLSPKIIQILNELLNADVILDKLQHLNRDDLSREEKQEKLKLWKQLTSTIITRLLAEIYCLALLVCYLRVQLSVIKQTSFAVSDLNLLQVIAGYIYVDSCATTQTINQTIQMKYLSLLNAFYQNGVSEIIKPVQEAVEHAVQHVSLKEKLSINDLKVIFEKVRKSMAFSLSGENSHASRYLLNANQIEQLANSLDDDEMHPQPEQLSPSEISTLTRMTQETQDILESDDFRRVLDSSIDVGYGLVLDSLVGCFVDQSDSVNGDINGFENPNARKVHLVKLLPSIKKVIDGRSNGHVDEQYNLVRHLLCLDILNCFAGNIYEAFCEPSKA